MGTQVVYSQENLTGNYNSILLTIYIKFCDPCYNCISSYSNVYTLSSCPLLIFYASILRPACHIHVPWHHTLNSTLNLCHPYMYHVYTMKNHVPWYHSYSRLFLILLDYSRPYDIISCDFLVMCHFFLLS